jgi:cytoskeletal protein CcmA (bactofilin family)
MGEVRIKKVEDGEIDTVLAEDIDFTGTINFEKPLMIKGKVKGDIIAHGDLYVDRGANVKAKIEANKVSARGRITGNILAGSKVELFSTAEIAGDIITKEIEIESGAKFNGNCTMGGGTQNEK